MRIARIIVPLFACTSLLVSCNSQPNETPDDTYSSLPSETTSSTAAIPVTSNVTYTGKVGRLDVSIAMQGTHKLTLKNGNVLLLASKSLNLEPYVGEDVEVFGSVQPTVEGSGTIMEVTKIKLEPIALSSSSPASVFCGGIAGIACPSGKTCVDDASDTCDPNNGGADCGGMCVLSDAGLSLSSSAVSSLTSSSVGSSSSKMSSSSLATSASSTSSSAAPVHSEAMEQQIVLMAKQNFEGSLWTQKYCTGHIGFCVPAHKNWYYKSFGATTTNLWHVEFGMSAIENLGDGAIVLNLANGTSASLGATDGQVRTQGSDVVGFKDWEGKHFEIVGDARLQTAIQYMVSHIEQYLP